MGGNLFQGGCGDVEGKPPGQEYRKGSYWIRADSCVVVVGWRFVNVAGLRQAVPISGGVLTLWRFNPPLPTLWRTPGALPVCFPNGEKKSGWPALAG